MTPAYIQLVWHTYKIRSSHGGPSSNIHSPTQVDLKNASYSVCNKRFSRKDGDILERFFKEGNDQQKLLRIIETKNPDDYKALKNFIDRRTKTPNRKTVEILAWLIDFQPRPYDSNINYKQLLEQLLKENAKSFEDTEANDWKEWMPEVGDEIEEDDDNESQDILKNDDEPVHLTSKQNDISPDNQPDPTEKIEENKPAEDLEAPQPAVPGPTPAPSKEEPPLIPVLLASPKAPVKKTALGGLFAAILLSVTGILVYNSNNSNNSSGDGILLGGGLSNQCMYWAGDHYEPLPCDQKIDDVAVIPVDTVRLRRFKKITRPDTITVNDIGRVWYAKINRQLEFYTFEGSHPTKPELRLKPITGYIIDKYIQNSQPAE